MTNVSPVSINFEGRGKDRLMSMGKKVKCPKPKKKLPTEPITDSIMIKSDNGNVVEALNKELAKDSAIKAYETKF